MRMQWIPGLPSPSPLRRPGDEARVGLNMTTILLECIRIKSSLRLPLPFNKGGLAGRTDGPKSPMIAVTVQYAMR